MIKLFRRIRQKLIDEGSLNRYLLYAIGEILLVVIGILIALSINEWNEDRINSNREKEILRSIKSEMVVNLHELKVDYERSQTYYEATIKVYDHIQKKPVESASMYQDFYNCVQFTYFFPKTSTYEMLKSGYLEIIRSDSLKEMITSVYEAGFKRIIYKVDTRRNAARLLFPYYQMHFNSKYLNSEDDLDFRKNNVKIGIPNNYSHLINDPEFETLILEAISGRSMFLSDFENTIGWVETCINNIDEYLKT